MGITENASYIKGLAEGLELDSSTKEGKVILKLIDLVSDLAEKVSVLENENSELYDYMEQMAEDIIDLEDLVYGDEESEDFEDYSDLNDDDDDFVFDEDDEYYEVECPSCGEKICFTDDIEMENLVCPACGEKVSDIEICDGDCESCADCEGCLDEE